MLAGRYLVISYIFLSRQRSLLFVTIDRPNQKRKKERASSSSFFFFFTSFLSCASSDFYIPRSSSFSSLMSFASSFVATIYYTRLLVLRRRRLFSIDFLASSVCRVTGVGRCCHAVPLVFPHPPISLRYPCILAPSASLPNELRVFFCCCCVFFNIFPLASLSSSCTNNS